jgi:hypothetical protein
MAEARDMVTRAIELIPALTPYGVDERNMKDTFDQRSLYKDASLRSVAISADWIKLQSQKRGYWLKKSWTHAVSSYVFKGAVEGYAGCFISHGAFICAALALGLTYQLRAGNQNVIFKLPVPEA